MVYMMIYDGDDNFKDHGDHHDVCVDQVGNLDFDNDDDLRVAPVLHLAKTTLVQKVTGMLRGL